MSATAVSLVVAAVFIMGVCVAAGILKDHLPPPFDDDDRGEEDER